ncbi:hypothetical protein BB560_006254, partial [Smittium megazygosporum]
MALPARQTGANNSVSRKKSEIPIKEVVENRTIGRILEPVVFRDDSAADPERWIRRYELFARKNGWSDIDRIDIMELYLDGKALIWFEKHRGTFENWVQTKT